MEKTYECCPYCGSEVELDAELKVQTCPVCGKAIVTCSMCSADSECCKHCCLEDLAHKTNEDNEKKPLSRLEIVKAVVGQFINMLENDILCENGTERFEDWCEKGEVYALNGLKKADVERCMELTNQLGDLTDDFIFRNLNPFDKDNYGL